MFKDKIEQCKTNLPRFLYKFYRNLEYAKDVIENDRLHLDMPSGYNDVFDSARVIDESEFDFVLYNNQIDSIVRYAPCEYKNLVFELLTLCPSTLLYLSDVFAYLIQNNIPCDVVGKIKSLFCQYLRNTQPFNNRIICFTRNKKSLLMWAHYAEHLKGVCLCFDTKKDPELFKHVYKVDYTRFRNRERNYNFYFSKSKEWSYEKEWRAVIQSDKEFIDTKSCVGLIIGERVSLGIPIKHNENGKLVESYASLSLAATVKGISVYIAKANPLEYKLDIEKYLN